MHTRFRLATCDLEIGRYSRNELTSTCLKKKTTFLSSSSRRREQESLLAGNCDVKDYKNFVTTLTLTRCWRRGVAPASLVRAAGIWKNKRERTILKIGFARWRVPIPSVTSVGNLRPYRSKARNALRDPAGPIAITFFEVTSVERRYISSAIIG